MLDRMNGLERTIVITAVIVGVLLLISNIVQNWAANRQKQREHQRDQMALSREHELELADREVEMWKAMLEKTPAPTIFSQQRRVPELVGRSQVAAGYELKLGDLVIYPTAAPISHGHVPEPADLSRRRAEIFQEPRDPEAQDEQAKDPP